MPFWFRRPSPAATDFRTRGTGRMPGTGNRRERLPLIPGPVSPSSFPASCVVCCVLCVVCPIPIPVLRQPGLAVTCRRRRGSGCSAFFHPARPCAQRQCQLWLAGSTRRRLAEVRWHSRCARRARARDEKTSSPPRGPRVLLEGTTHGPIAYQPASNWFQNHLHQHAPERARHWFQNHLPSTRAGACCALVLEPPRPHAAGRVPPTGPGATLGDTLAGGAVS